MKVLYLDCFSGISGDMTVGALIDAGVDVNLLREGIVSLGLPGVEIRAQKLVKKGITATKFDVLVDGRHAEDHEHHHPDQQGHDHGHEHEHTHEHVHHHRHDHDHGHGHVHTHGPHTHEHHHHDHGHDHVHSHDHDHDHTHVHTHAHSHHHSHDHGHEPHRHLPEIVALIQGAALPQPVKDAAIETFELLGAAEAAVHGTTIDQVHFHEVGAIDSIVDIVAAQYALHLLGVEEVHCSPLHVGAGTVKCAHGIMPVPAPATALLLKGRPTYGGAVQGELVTPTGAALIAQRVKRFGGAPEMLVDTIGYGSGTKDLADRPNVLRVMMGEAAVERGMDTVAILEANVDDMSGELVAPLIEALLAAGARDAFSTAVSGKKGRPAQRITAICDEAKTRLCAEQFFRHSTTFGVRVRSEKRYVLDREWKRARTPWGDVRVKLGSWDGELLQQAPEFEDCREVAEKAGIPVRQVYAAAAAAASRGEWSE
ncbi:MAG: nickel pincer cofactor biosynthesis protein LarC [Candidatus Hydrogenedentes bacterium]|nr:nickel pincer cofactor biosynthesis protein LarC [Candidatus Hydrogenedentota bacterium]